MERASVEHDLSVYELREALVDELTTVLTQGDGKSPVTLMGRDGQVIGILFAPVAYSFVNAIVRLAEQPERYCKLQEQAAALAAGRKISGSAPAQEIFSKR